MHHLLKIPMLVLTTKALHGCPKCCGRAKTIPSCAQAYLTDRLASAVLKHLTQQPGNSPGLGIVSTIPHAE